MLTRLRSSCRIFISDANEWVQGNKNSLDISELLV